MSLLASLTEAQLHPGAASSLIPSGWQPATDVAVDFDGVQLHNGNLLRVSRVQKAPAIAFKAESDASPDALYTLMLIDPDAPTPADPKFAFWRHWVVRSVKPGVNVSGKTLTEFLAPGPKPEYVFATLSSHLKDLSLTAVALTPTDTCSSSSANRPDSPSKRTM